MIRKKDTFSRFVNGKTHCYNPTSRDWELLKSGYIDQGIFSNLSYGEKQLKIKGANYIIPGFIDAHCHLLENPYPGNYSEEGRSLPSIALRNALDAARCGITTLKDMGGYNYKAIEILKMLANFKVPRLFTSGCYFTTCGGHCSDHGAIEINNYDDFVAGLQPLIDNQIQFCKIINSDDGFSPELLKKMISYAHKNRMMVSCHAYTQKAAFNAVLAGTDTLEHAGDYNDELLEMIKEKNVIIVPTYVAAVDSSLDNCSNLADVNQDIIDEWLRGENVVIKKLFNKHIKVALGTDSGFLGTPCDSLLREIELLHNNFGIPLDELLFSAFVVTPCTVGMDDKIGKIENGYYADFLCYDENPLLDIDVLMHPKEVWVNGERIDHVLYDKIIIRRLQNKDVENLSEHMRQYYFDCAELDDYWNDEEITAWVTDRKDYCTGAFNGDEIIGFCLTHYHMTANKVHIENIFVKEAYRGEGIAQYLLFDAISFYRMRCEKVRFVSLVDTTNSTSLSLFERNGFTKGHPMNWMQFNSYYVL